MANNTMPPAATPPTSIAPDDVLQFHVHQRAIVQYGVNEHGRRELTLYHRDKEVSFDEPELFAFAETLATQSRFLAHSATQWGAGYEWPRIRGLLEQLLAAGVLFRGANLPDPRALQPAEATMPSPLPPAQTTVPRTWFECEAVTGELTGRALEMGYLELVVPVFRVAHMAMDQEGRQVGEANVFPPALRLDVPTHWKRCIYSGSRYLSPLPMNVSALKSMRAHWAQMMAILLRVRAAYLLRFPEARRGWTVGHLERLATVVLAVPSYALMRAAPRVANGELHPALASLFRVTDGLRLTMHQMLFVPIGEPTLPPDKAMTSEEVFAYAERNFSFHSEHAVCAGPVAMIKEFLRVIVDGEDRGEPVVFDPEVESALADLDAAIDYGLLGLQAYAAVFSFWPLMTRTYEKLAAIMHDSKSGTTAADAFRRRLLSHLAKLKNETFLAEESWRIDRETVYADMYRQCAAGLAGRVEVPSSLPEQIERTPQPEHAAIEARLRDVVFQRLGSSTEAPAAELNRVIECIMNYLVREQALLDVACDSQQKINTLLGRPAPERAFTGHDIDVHLRLLGTEARQRKLPYLVTELEEILGIALTVTRDTLTLTAV